MSINHETIESLRSEVEKQRAKAHKYHSAYSRSYTEGFNDGMTQGRYETAAGATAYYFYMAGFLNEHSTSDRFDAAAALFEDMGWQSLGVLKTLA